MPPGKESSRYLSAVVVVFLVAMLLFVSPAVLLWTSPASPWYVPYVLWAGVIGMALFVNWIRTRHEL